MFNSTPLPAADYINATASENNQYITMYICKDNTVHKAELKNFNILPYMENPPVPFYHCDEIWGFSDGKYLTRKQFNIKLCV